MDPSEIARVTGALALALGLAIVGAHPTVRTIERRLGVSTLAAAGLPMLLLGAFFGTSGIGVLSPEILADLGPVYDFGLGWIGFVAGSRLDFRRIETAPRSLVELVGWQTALPLVTTVVLCGPTLLALDVRLGEGLVFDLLLLGGCAATSSPSLAHTLVPRFGKPAARLVEEVVVLDAVAALGMLGAVAVWAHPDAESARWVLPPIAWGIVLVGLGATLGILTWFLLRSATDDDEEVALLLGAVALSAGVAGYLALSGAVVCAVAGAVLANLPVEDRPGLLRELADLERPVGLIFLALVGATWHPGEWQGWVLGFAFFVARVAGKGGAAAIARRLDPSLPTPGALARALLPQGPHAIVIIAGASAIQGTAAAPAPLRWATHAVILGTLLTEVLAQALRRRFPPRGAA